MSPRVELSIDLNGDGASADLKIVLLATSTLALAASVDFWFCIVFCSGFTFSSFSIIFTSSAISYLTSSGAQRPANMVAPRVIPTSPSSNIISYSSSSSYAFMYSWKYELEEEPPVRTMQVSSSITIPAFSKTSSIGEVISETWFSIFSFRDSLLNSSSKSRPSTSDSSLT